MQPKKRGLRPVPCLPALYSRLLQPVVSPAPPAPVPPDPAKLHLPGARASLGSCAAPPDRRSEPSPALSRQSSPAGAMPFSLSCSRNCLTTTFFLVRSVPGRSMGGRWSHACGESGNFGGALGGALGCAPGGGASEGALRGGEGAFFWRLWAATLGGA